MKETFTIWKTILSKPTEGYRLILPTTNLIIPLLFIVILTVLSGLLTLPMVTSPAYAGAYTRAILNHSERLGALADPGARAAQEKMLADPSVRAIAAFAAVATPPLNLLLALLAGTVLLWFLSFILRNRIPFGVMLRILVFTWFVLAWAGLLQSLLLLFSDHQTLFGRVNTLLQFNASQTVPFSLAAVFPAGSVSLPVAYAVDFGTNIFHVIFYVLLALGVRTIGPDRTPWKTGVAVGFFLLIHFSIGFMVIIFLA